MEAEQILTDCHEGLDNILTEETKTKLTEAYRTQSARIAELEANQVPEGLVWITREEFGRIEKFRGLKEALEKLHEECSVARGGQRLNFGPMIAPSEQAVLKARKALKEATG